LIEGNNFFKLRDLAFVLRGTEKQFDVGWSGRDNAIILTSGSPYISIGGEMARPSGGTRTPVLTRSRIIKDRVEIQLISYLIDGHNYFRLRDIGAAFNFAVDWDAERDTIIIDTTREYLPDPVVLTPSFTSSVSGRETYDGERDASGRRSGYGVWTYHYENHSSHYIRYEGKWSNDAPNGWGRLYAMSQSIDSWGSGNQTPERVLEGNFANGIAYGMVKLTQYYDNGDVAVWTFELQDGLPIQGLGQVKCPDTGLILSFRHSDVYGVPPWAEFF
jgi:hypothetical protein